MKLNNLHIEGYHGSYYIPQVDLDAKTGICEISGESYLEDTANFYAPILSWVEKYYLKIKKPIVFNFKLNYYNTSSSKCIVDLLVSLKKYSDLGQDVTVNWYYDSKSEDHEEDIEEVEDFMIETGIKINLKDK